MNSFDQKAKNRQQERLDDIKYINSYRTDYGDSVDEYDRFQTDMEEEFGSGYEEEIDDAFWNNVSKSESESESGSGSESGSESGSGSESEAALPRAKSKSGSDADAIRKRADETDAQWKQRLAEAEAARKKKAKRSLTQRKVDQPQRAAAADLANIQYMESQMNILERNQLRDRSKKEAEDEIRDIADLLVQREALANIRDSLPEDATKSEIEQTVGEEINRIRKDLYGTKKGKARDPDESTKFNYFKKNNIFGSAPPKQSEKAYFETKMNDLLQKAEQKIYKNKLDVYQKTASLALARSPTRKTPNIFETKSLVYKFERNKRLPPEVEDLPEYEKNLIMQMKPRFRNAASREYVAARNRSPQRSGSDRASASVSAKRSPRSADSDATQPILENERPKVRRRSPSRPRSS